MRYHPQIELLLAKLVLYKLEQQLRSKTSEATGQDTRNEQQERKPKGFVPPSPYSPMLMTDVGD